MSKEALCPHDQASLVCRALPPGGRSCSSQENINYKPTGIQPSSEIWKNLQYNTCKVPFVFNCTWLKLSQPWLSIWIYLDLCQQAKCILDRLSARCRADTETDNHRRLLESPINPTNCTRRRKFKLLHEKKCNYRYYAHLIYSST